MKHTPGPWTIKLTGYATYTILEAAKRVRNRMVDHPNPEDIKKYGTGEKGEEIANAHLIAASPDLLLAAKDAKLRLEAIGATTIGLTQAIAKAEGGDNA